MKWFISRKLPLNQQQVCCIRRSCLLWFHSSQQLWREYESIVRRLCACGAEAEQPVSS